MKLIATHNSATGERPTWWSSPLTLFARCQNKTIKEQLEAGCTLFDIRIKKVFGVWRCAHGWWFTSKSVDDIIYELDSYSKIYNKKIFVSITIEGKNKNFKENYKFISLLRNRYYHLYYLPVSCKYGKDSKGLKVKYDIIMPALETTPNINSEQAFLPLDGVNWQTYIPIPILWKQFYFKNVEFNEEVYKFVDFL